MPEWKYLLTEPFIMRQLLAAQIVRNCKNIIEIGSYRLPIAFFLIGPHSRVYCVDPVTPPEIVEGCEMRNGRTIVTKEIYVLQESLTDVIGRLGKVRDLGLVALGFDLPEEQWPAMLSLVKNSDLFVLESWATWHLYTGFRDLVKRESGKSVAFRLGLDMSGNDLGDMSFSHPVRTDREMVVFR